MPRQLITHGNTLQTVRNKTGFHPAVVCVGGWGGCVALCICMLFVYMPEWGYISAWCFILMYFVLQLIGSCLQLSMMLFECFIAMWMHFLNLHLCT